MTKKHDNDIEDDEIRIISSSLQMDYDQCECYHAPEEEDSAYCPDAPCEPDSEPICYRAISKSVTDAFPRGGFDGSASPTDKEPAKSRRTLIIIILIVLASALIALVLWFVFRNYDSKSTAGSEFVLDTRLVEADPAVTDMPVDESAPASMSPKAVTITAAYAPDAMPLNTREIPAPLKASTIISDTVCGSTPLVILTPQNAVPSLYVGNDIFADSTVVLAAQAADIRLDNGGIVGTFVLDGNLLSKGQSKSGFCAIVNSRLTIGVAESTPLLEEALESHGYFFRQYPLVVAGQIVENKPQGLALRKALAELNGQTVVVLSRRRITFHEFSQALVDLGVSNAIYLTGANAYGEARDANGNTFSFGTKSDSEQPETNYIVWR